MCVLGIKTDAVKRSILGLAGRPGWPCTLRLVGKSTGIQVDFINLIASCNGRDWKVHAHWQCLPPRLGGGVVRQDVVVLYESERRWILRPVVRSQANQADGAAPAKKGALRNCAIALFIPITAA